MKWLDIADFLRYLVSEGQLFRRFVNTTFERKHRVNGGESMARVTRPSKENAPKSAGRPTKYNAKIADEICERLALGQSLREICRDPKMVGMATVIRWIREDREGFDLKYTQARALQAHTWVDQMKDLATSLPEKNPLTGSYDSASVNHIRNQVMTLQWLAMKLNSKRYGDQARLSHDVAGGLNLRVITGVPDASDETN
jgi:transposase